MNVLVIGGSGFLSGAVARASIAAGHATWAVTRGVRPMPAGVRPVIADRKNPAAFAAVVADAGVAWDLVVDCIGFSADDARQDLSAFAGRAGHLVFISTDFTLDPINRPWQVDETYARYDPDSAYGRGKREAELIFLNGAEDAGLPVTVLRPCHIYGPGSQLGCLPVHGRDPKLIDRLRAGETLRLVGGGHFVQQPVRAADLAQTALACPTTPGAANELFLTPGPDVVASVDYYRIVADVLGVPLAVEEIPIAEHLRNEPSHRSFCCHRAYSTAKGRAAGLPMPSTPLAVGLREHADWLLAGSPAL